MTGGREEAPVLRGNINRGAMGGMEASALARMLPAVPSSRGGLSRDAASPNHRAGCGGRRGSRQIRARRPRQQRRGREGERQWPPEQSPRLRRLGGARAAAGAMLEELECGAPGARGAAAGQFGPALRGRGGAARGLRRPRRQLGADGPPGPRPVPLRRLFGRGGCYGRSQGPATRRAPSTLLLRPRPFSPALLRQLVLAGLSAVTGRCVPEGRPRPREAEGLALQVAECVCVP